MTLREKLEAKRDSQIGSSRQFRQNGDLVCSVQARWAANLASLLIDRVDDGATRAELRKEMGKKDAHRQFFNGIDSCANVYERAWDEMSNAISVDAFEAGAANVVGAMRGVNNAAQETNRVLRDAYPTNFYMQNDFYTWEGQGRIISPTGAVPGTSQWGQGAAIDWGYRPQARMAETWQAPQPVTTPRDEILARMGRVREEWARQYNGDRRF